jgi:hypothetical protein
MKHALLISVAALALAAASPTLTLAQKQGGGAPGANGMSAPAGTAAPAANPSGANGPTTGAPGAAEQQPSESPAPRATAPGGNRGAQDRTIPDKQRTGEQAPAKQPAQQQGQATPHEQPGASKQGASGQQPGGSKQGASETREGGAKQGAAERPMTSKSVSLTTEQKTTIRTKVLTSSAPRVTNVNFDIKIGVAVPRTVRVVPVPVTIVEIEPTWRGYMYFVSGDQIIIVEPRTLEIVAVLDV